jgi:hypothetical protein
MCSVYTYNFGVLSRYPLSFLIIGHGVGGFENFDTWIHGSMYILIMFIIHIFYCYSKTSVNECFIPSLPTLEKCLTAGSLCDLIHCWHRGLTFDTNGYQVPSNKPKESQSKIRIASSLRLCRISESKYVNVGARASNGITDIETHCNGEYFSETISHRTCIQLRARSYSCNKGVNFRLSKEVQYCNQSVHTKIQPQ